MCENFLYLDPLEHPPGPGAVELCQRRPLLVRVALLGRADAVGGDNQEGVVVQLSVLPGGLQPETLNSWH